MKKATLVIIVREDGRVLLGFKRAGAEVGGRTWNGPGGKLEGGETLEECAVRETDEELRIALDPEALEKLGIITAHVQDEPTFEIHLFWTNVFSGEPCETKDMTRPTWYEPEELPFDGMLEADRAWFMRAVLGEHFNAHIFYKEPPVRNLPGNFLGITYLD